ncbi:MAG: NUDIX domain-containing protein [Candidatus Wildermuthbacteria bacterium]|nr:NUDIX domain-containing protein [Candidatus Wildermuthbacteria bacterium]
MKYPKDTGTMVLAVSGLVCDRLGQFLILRRSIDDDFLPGQWEVPGGEVKFGESPSDALSRETYEECGLEIDVGLPLFVTTYFIEPSNEEQCFEIFYYCKPRDPDQEIRLSTEHSAYRWTTLVGLTDIQMTTSTRDLIGSLANHPLTRVFVSF